MTTQATTPAPAQVSEPVHPIHQEAKDLATFTRIVQGTPDNDPDDLVNSSEPKFPKEAAPETTPEAAPEAAEEAEVQFDEESPVFEIDYKTDSGKEKKKLSLKELREGYLAKQDYHRNIQKVKAQEAALAEQAQKAELKAIQHFSQQLETYKQAVVKFAAPELMNVDLNQLAQTDPAEAQRIFFKQIQLNQTLNAIAQEQQRAQQAMEGQKQKDRAEAINKTRSYLQENIKDWDDSLYQSLLKTGTEDYGLQVHEIDETAVQTSPKWMKVLHDAYQYRQLQKAKPQVEKKVVTLPKVVKPGSAENKNPSSEDNALDRLKKTGKGEDFVNWYMKKHKGK